MTRHPRDHLAFRRLGRGFLPYAFMALPVVYLGIFMFWPLGRQIWLSLTRTRLTNPNNSTFVGMDNYERLFASGDFYSSLGITVIYSGVVVIVGVALGMISALALNRPFPGRSVVRAVLLFGWAVPNVASALIWLWIFNERSGVLNRIVTGLGLDRMSWLTSTDLALPSVLVVTIWQVAPFVMLVMLAALQSVPEEVQEAARVDGADRLNVFRHVTLPHVMPMLQLVSLLVTVWSIRRFDIIYLMTGGGPVGSTSTLIVRLRQIAFENYDLGLASAYGVIGLILALAVAAVHATFSRRRAKGAAQ
ncbi:carbohydrate ABC transporter permease [Celeribacter indicus]|uniref:ABC transporter, membrane spanning protein n=1 Tax=Celeribacter indicus TaxID=1208324 RepID=A0A0B5E0B5_9RHOB|nr:sugar ABC transporter permease [Celeribacter indicus]AJE48664.1 ABC transporter, membrane spanning protein [Celeribacter indicus]SDX35224.1 carbohydrate ABC transporter membrane protein 1, CUT1 family [Celeribacter indicus]